MQNFYINHEMENQKKSEFVNYEEINNRLIKGIIESKQTSEETNNKFNLDKKTFKNDINQRMNNMTNHDLFYKRLPLNNNIRDYNITIDTNKDEFNNR